MSDPAPSPEYPAQALALARTSRSAVDDRAPDDTELAELVAAAGRVADHSTLRPWRLLTMRGDARHLLGAALADAAGEAPGSEKRAKAHRKAERAPLVIAVVASITPKHKVHAWEQEAVAAGVAHLLSLLLFERGWGVMWRSGEYTRHPAVHEAHGLAEHEVLLGWLYVGGTRDRDLGKTLPAKRRIDPAEFLSALAPSAPAAGAGADALPEPAEAKPHAEHHPGKKQRRPKPPKRSPEEVAEYRAAKYVKKAKRHANKAEKYARKAVRSAERLAELSEAAPEAE
ncbi:nitroreductase family protein [Leucobacter sp. M11]|uniref:nitroreductase family protein n=1 Tax=Leucobacter sp. M11 TaxID=2993565 RepID=UPI002D7F4152|nr:nitroreductase family protein [Leucobacter sp. M11]